MVDSHGWLAAVTGMPPVDRVPLPDSFGAGRTWLPSLGTCVAEPMPGGWLLRVTGADDLGSAGRVVLDLGEPRRPHITVSGTAGSWAQDLSPRHAELLYVLAVHRQGRSAAQLAVDLFGDPTRTVTVRAELSRVRQPAHRAPRPPSVPLPRGGGGRGPAAGRPPGPAAALDRARGARSTRDGRTGPLVKARRGEAGVFRGRLPRSSTWPGGLCRSIHSTGHPTRLSVNALGGGGSWPIREDA